jgi:hypothetical protein
MVVIQQCAIFKRRATKKAELRFDPQPELLLACDIRHFSNDKTNSVSGRS